MWGLSVMSGAFLILYSRAGTGFPKILQREEQVSRRQVMKPSPAVRRGAVLTVEDPVSVPKPQVYTLIPCYNNFPAVL